MKHISSEPQGRIHFYSLLSDAEKEIFKHHLSPLQLAALQHNFEPFNYKIKESFFYISRNACRQLMESIGQNLSFLKNQVRKEETSKEIPLALREVFEDPKEILSLPAFARVKLCKLECYTMLRVMLLGRNYFEKKPLFGKKALLELDMLFERHGCIELFR